MCEITIPIRQALDNNDLEQAITLCDLLKNCEPGNKMLETKIKALRGWALVLNNQIEKARKLISPIEGDDITATAVWIQIISNKIDDPDRNRLRWVDESLLFWGTILEADPKNTRAMDAAKQLKAEQIALFAKLHAKELQLVNEESERAGGPIISS